MDFRSIAFNIVGVIFALIGAIVYWRAARRIRETGGKVETAPLGQLDVIVCAIWVTLLLSAAIPALFKSGPDEPMKVSHLLIGSALVLMLAAAIDLLLVRRHIDVGELVGIRYLPPADAARTGLRLIVCAYPLVLATSFAANFRNPAPEAQPIISFFVQAVKSNDVLTIVLAFFCAGLIAPASEEFLFRGYLHPVVKKYGGLLAGLFVNSLVFALIHADAPTLAPLFILALALTAAYELTGSILVPVIMHALFNLATLFGILLAALSQR